MRCTIFPADVQTHRLLYNAPSYALCSMTIALQWWCFERERQAGRTRRTDRLPLQLGRIRGNLVS
jgi:hypothetical protein